MNPYTYATHNSMTYLKPYWWAVRLIGWMARCQNKDMDYQLKHGVRIFDFRLKTTRKNRYVFQHGLCRYSSDNGKGDVFQVLDKINRFAHQHNHDIYVRVTCEILNDNQHQKTCFKELCTHIEYTYKHIKFFGGNAKYNWSQGVKIHRFKHDAVNEQITERFRSRYHATIFPWIWAVFGNKKHKAQAGTKPYLMLDFFQLPDSPKTTQTRIN